MISTFWSIIIYMWEMCCVNKKKTQALANNIKTQKVLPVAFTPSNEWKISAIIIFGTNKLRYESLLVYNFKKI